MFRVFLTLSFFVSSLGFLTTTTRADEIYGSKMNTQKRVIQLPTDGGKWFVSVFGDSPKVIRWFQTHEGLKSLRNQTHFNLYPTESVEYQKKYRPALPGKICIRVQNHKGVIVSEFWDEYIPMTPDALYEGIRSDIEDKTSWGCPLRRRHPTPEPAPQPIIDPIIQPIKPVLNPLGTVKSTINKFLMIGLGLLSVLIGGGIGIAQSVAKEFASKK